MQNKRRVGVTFFALLLAGCLYVPAGNDGGSATNPSRSYATCTNSRTYDVTLEARNQFPWPWFDTDCGGSDLLPWHRLHHKGHWLGRTFYFDDLDKEALSQVRLEHETLVVDALIYDYDDVEFNRIEVNMDGFKGASLNSGAVTTKVLKSITLPGPMRLTDDEAFEKDVDKAPKVHHGDKNRKDHLDSFEDAMNSNWHQRHSDGESDDQIDFDNSVRADRDRGDRDSHDRQVCFDENGHRRGGFDCDNDNGDRGDWDRDGLGRKHHHHYEARKLQVVEISFHLEDYTFGVSHTAADLLRQNALSNGTVAFKLRNLKGATPHLFRLFDGDLHLQGIYPGICSTPSPSSSPTAKPSPTATARPSPSPTGKPTPTPTPTPVPSPSPSPSPLPSPIATITNTSVGALTNVTSVSISFVSNVAGSTFLCSLDSNPYNACSSPFTANGLADGAHNFSVEAVANGITGSPAQFSWTVDTTPPVVTFGTITPPGPAINVNQITINFSANESATFTCSLDSAAASPCSSPVTYSNVTDGSHSLSVIATDLAGNVGQAASYNWLVETTPPTVTITQVIPAGNPSNSTVRTFYFTATADAVSFLCSLDSDTPAACTSPYSVTGLTDGAHQVSIWAVDEAGNQSQPAQSSFTIDTVPPTVLITQTIPGNTPTNQTSMQISFSADESSTFTCSLDGAAMSACASPMSYAGLADGNHSFDVVATDVAGNVSATPGTYNWTIDTVVPVVTFVSANPAGSLFNSSTVTLNFAVSKTGTSSACTLDGGNPVDCTSDSVTSMGMPDGAHTIAVVATDAAGNVSVPFDYSFTTDTTAPIVQITNVYPSQSISAFTYITVSFQAADIASVTYTCKLDSKTAATCASPVNYTGLAPGAHMITISAKDAAGNVSVAPATYSWTIDLNPPVTSITSEDPNTSPTNSTSMVFAFTADKPSTYMCSLDGGGSVPCSSPSIYNGLSDGNHTFIVVATDMAGNVDPDGASYSWTVNTQPLTVSGFGVSSVTATTVTLQWMTNLPSDSQVFYALFPSTTYTPGPYDPTLVVNHSVTVQNLTPNGFYSVYPESNAGTEQATSPTINFRTSNPPP